MHYLFATPINLCVWICFMFVSHLATASDSTSCFNRSKALYIKGQYQDAYKSFYSCTKESDSASYDYHTCILYLGKCALENAEYKKATSFLNTAILYFDQSDENYFFCKQSLAALSKRQGKYAEAETILLDILSLQEDISYTDCASKAITLNDLGVICKRLGQYERAIQYFTKSLQIKSNCPDAEESSITISMNNLAGTYMKQKEYKKADSLYSEAIKIKTKQYGPNHPSTLVACNNLAELYRQQGNYATALVILQDIKTRKAASSGKHTLSYATTLHTIANVYHSSKEYTKAMPYCRRSISIKEQLTGTNSSTSMHSYILQAKIYHMLGKNKKATSIYDFILRTKKDEINTYFQYLGEEDKIQYTKSNITYWKDFTTFVFDMDTSTTQHSNEQLFNQWIENRWYVSEIILEETQRQHRLWESIKDSSQLKLIHELKEIKDSIATIYLIRSKDDDKSINELTALTDRASQLEKRITSTFISDVRKQHTVNEILNALDSTECIVEIIKPLTATDRYLALVYLKGICSPYKIWLPQGTALEGKGYSYYMNCIKFRLNDTKSHELYWKKIKDVIDAYTNIHKIYLVRDGIYEFINIHTLFPEAGEHIPSIIYLNKTENILSYKEHTSEIRITHSLFIYHPAYSTTGNDCSYTDLPGTQDEINAIVPLFKNKSLPVTLYGEKMASETRIKEDTSDYSIIHIATHGYLDMNPEESYIESMIHSGLLLSGVCDPPKLEAEDTDDGVLTSYEIAQLNLNKTELVVLSACQSGLGVMDNQEGILGLQRGLFVAGTKKILVSLWKIDDAITSEWMYYFYSNLVETKSCFRAYMFAQQKIKELYISPYYWGAFVLLEQ